MVVTHTAGPGVAVVVKNRVIGHCIWGGNLPLLELFGLRVEHANLLAAKAQAEQVAGRVFNVATGTRADLNETFEVLKKLIGFSGTVKYGPDREGDVKHSLADISSAEKYLGYKPQVNFEEGLRRTVEWYRGETKAAKA